ncbi:MAG: metallophosphoesterase [Erythrobacter sp.]|nr:metallophosphoesterase [Erythrobacter sp.]
MRRLLARIARHWKLLLVLKLAVVGLLAAKAWHDTMADPEVLRTTVALPGLPAGSPPITVALISDIHVAGPDMPPARVERIVAQVNALHPDLVAIAGDLVSEKGLASQVYTPAEVVAPLAALRARLGVLVVPGNHDHWYDWPALQRELHARGIRTLQNEAAEIGPLAVGGVDDAYTRRDDLPLVVDQMRDLPGAQLIVTHSPDIFPHVPPDVSLVLAGHTHCGQIRLPFVGAVSSVSRYGDRFECGVIVEGGRRIIVGGGLGTSVLPMRFGTQPQVWLVTLVPE